MTTKAKANQNKFFQQRISQINKVIEKFESEVEKTVEKIKKRSEKSSRLIKRNFDEIVNRISSSELYSMASEKTEEFRKELRRVADEVVSKFKSFEFGSSSAVLKEIRQSLDTLVEKLQNLELVEVAKEKAQSTRRQIFSVLSIPSREDVDELSKKISHLEKKIKTITSRPAMAA